VRRARLLTIKAKHFPIGRQSLFNQLSDCFVERYHFRSRFDHSGDYLVLAHHLDCFRIDTHGALISTE
jgi:hypothetical protein